MIEKSYEIGGFEVSCDECSNHTVCFTEDWNEAIEEIKEEGWRIYKDSAGNWTHACPSCVEDWIKEQRDD